jgi:hypothetical protein
MALSMEPIARHATTKPSDVPNTAKAKTTSKTNFVSSLFYLRSLRLLFKKTGRVQRVRLSKASLPSTRKLAE